ncbi:hypothetical protein niasHT_023498 [Heterodera trifolii]|uniref:IPT/TIG domain-containing protein n=1 Tax=Heterodera trifolii TaxID=157864 RepID=A0ABD2JJM7_9BILA
MNIFKCPLLASDCSHCVALDPRFACTWCCGSCKHSTKCMGRDADGGTAEANELCTTPAIREFSPRSGPLEGGTVVDIVGHDLGSRLLDNLECSILEKRESDRVICLTAASPRAYTVTAIRLQIDGAVRPLPAKFEYRTDPELRDVQPRTAYESGGRKLIVTVRPNKDYGLPLGFGAVPKIVSAFRPTVPSVSPDELELVSELGACHPLNSSALSCDSPSLALPTALLRQSSMARWMVGMAMDGVRTVRNLGPTIQLTTVPDPQFSPFAGLHILQAKQPLMLSGQWLSQAAMPAEYSVTIGTSLCPVSLLEPDRLLLNSDEMIGHRYFGAKICSGASPHSSSGTDPTVHFHLQQPSGIAGGGTSNSERPSRERRSATMLSEVFLTRLLMCKGTDRSTLCGHIF